MLRPATDYARRAATCVASGSAKQRARTLLGSAGPDQNENQTKPQTRKRPGFGRLVHGRKFLHVYGTAPSVLLILALQFTAPLSSI